MLANLDGHTDWVNQIKAIEGVNTLISCSNDTTIRLWRYKTDQEYRELNGRMRDEEGKCGMEPAVYR